MKKFLKNISLILTPIVLVLAPAYMVLAKAGEMDDLKDIVHPLEKDQQIGLAYSDATQPYKFIMTDSVFRPQVLALGSSRIMQVRRNIVNPSYSFYNAGGAVRHIYEFECFIKKLKYNPELIILNMDQFYFNPNYVNQKKAFNPYIYDTNDIPIPKKLFNCLTFYKDIMVGKVSAKVLDSNNIGVNARVNQNGFQYDGSYRYGQTECYPQKSKDYGFADTKKRINNKNKRFEACKHADKSVLATFDRFLDECERRNIKVITIIPPFAPTINKILREDGGYLYMNEIEGILQPLFSCHKNAKLFNFRDVEGYDDSYYIDGFHGSLVIYNAIIKQLATIPEYAKYFLPVDSIDCISDKYKYRFQ